MFWIKQAIEFRLWERESGERERAEVVEEERSAEHHEAGSTEGPDEGPPTGGVEDEEEREGEHTPIGGPPPEHPL